MRLKLNVTYPAEQELAATVPTVAIVDDARVSWSAGTVDQAQPVRAAPVAGGVERCVIDDTFGEQNVVPDVDRYRLRRQQGQITLHPHTVRGVCPDSNNFCDILTTERNVDYDKTIVIVLESPHKDEYENSATPSGDVGRPIAPAQGKTGTRIRNFFHHVLCSCPTLCGQLEEHTTRVVISNPVPFQASLASIVSIPASENDSKSAPKRKRKKLRDAVWSALWEYGAIQDDFQTRLESYCPDFIINACTHDVGCYLQRCCVANNRCKKHKMRTFLNEHFNVSSCYEVNHHPSVWNGATQLRPACG